MAEMKVLNAFCLITKKKDNDDEILDVHGYPIIQGIRLGFENAENEDVVFPDGTESDDYHKHLNTDNIVLSATCAVDEDDETWLEWFMNLVKMDSCVGLDPIESQPAIENKPETVHVGKRKAGCKLPTKVNGWQEGRILTATKKHLVPPFGSCFYQVKCEAEGSYELIDFKGNRNDIQIGDRWSTVSEMFRWLLGMYERGKGETIAKSPHWKKLHKMTIPRWFDN